MSLGSWISGFEKEESGVWKRAIALEKKRKGDSSRICGEASSSFSSSSICGQQRIDSTFRRQETVQFFFSFAIGGKVFLTETLWMGEGEIPPPLSKAKEAFCQVEQKREGKRWVSLHGGPRERERDPDCTLRCLNKSLGGNLPFPFFLLRQRRGKNREQERG